MSMKGDFRVFLRREHLQFETPPIFTPSSSELPEDPASYPPPPPSIPPTPSEERRSNASATAYSYNGPGGTFDGNFHFPSHTGTPLDEADFPPPFEGPLSGSFVRGVDAADVGSRRGSVAADRGSSMRESLENLARTGRRGAAGFWSFVNEPKIMSADEYE
jgi:hypothetical protein